MNFHIVTIFPEMFDSYFNESIIKRARENKIIDIEVHDLRKWTADRHRTVDDAPYGGGAGMVMMIDPMYRALRAVKSQIQNPPAQGPSPRLQSGADPPREEVRLGRRSASSGESRIDSKSKIQNSKTVLLSAKGKTWNQLMAKRYSKLDEVILLCGRYEGVDERVTKFVDEEVSIGDYVLTGGEIPAMVVVDSVTRLLPGVLGNSESAENESHSEAGLLEYPQYTRPEVFEADGRKYRVPKVLLSGNHGKIALWRKNKMKKAK